MIISMTLIKQIAMDAVTELFILGSRQTTPKTKIHRLIVKDSVDFSN